MDFNGDDSGPQSPEPPWLLRMWRAGLEPTSCGNFFNYPPSSTPPGLGGWGPLRKPVRAAASHSFSLCDRLCSGLPAACEADAHVYRLAVSACAGAAGKAERILCSLRSSSFGLGEVKRSPDGQVQGVHV